MIYKFKQWHYSLTSVQSNRELDCILGAVHSYFYFLDSYNHFLGWTVLDYCREAGILGSAYERACECLYTRLSRSFYSFLATAAISSLWLAGLLVAQLDRLRDWPFLFIRVHLMIIWQRDLVSETVAGDLGAWRYVGVRVIGLRYGVFTNEQVLYIERMEKA